MAPDSVDTSPTTKPADRPDRPNAGPPDAPEGRRVRRTAREFGPHPIDRHVGERIRERRTLIGWSQTTLAERLGVSFQQVQKYERGSNRVSASTLWQIAHVLGVSPSYFFEGLDSDLPEITPGNGNVPHKRETLELARTFSRISDPELRAMIVDLAKALSESPAGAANKPEAV